MTIPTMTESAPRHLVGLSWPIVVIGVISAGIYATAFTFSWPLWQFYDQPQADYAWFGRYTKISQAVYVGAFAVLFALQYVAYRLVRAQPEAAPLDTIVAGQVIFGLLN